MRRTVVRKALVAAAALALVLPCPIYIAIACIQFLVSLQPIAALILGVGGDQRLKIDIYTQRGGKMMFCGVWTHILQTTIRWGVDENSRLKRACILQSTVITEVEFRRVPHRSDVYHSASSRIPSPLYFTASHNDILLLSRGHKHRSSPHLAFVPIPRCFRSPVAGRHRIEVQPHTSNLVI